MWTLEYDGVEQSLAAWGLSEGGVSRRRANMAADVLTLRAAGPMEGTAAFAYGAAVIVRRDRAGSGTAWSGGSIYFQGKVGNPVRAGAADAEGISYVVLGPWADLERLVFQQEWNQFAGWKTPGDPSSDPTYTVKRTSELFLGQALAGTKLTTGGQITEALNWAATCGVNLAVGTIDPAVNFVIYNVRDITVAEVIQQMCRWSPDVICWFDYTQTVPTFHARSLANLSAVALTADNVVGEVELVPRYDLQLPAVCLRFKRTDTVDGRPSVVIEEQNAPAEATGTEIGASVHTIELMGSQTNNVYGELECVACDATSGTAGTRLAWWRLKEPLLGSPYLDPNSVTVGGATVTDDDGAAVSLETYPNELVSGQVASWMLVGEDAVVEVRATIKATAGYDLYRVPVRRNGATLEVYTNSAWTSTNTEKFLLARRSQELSANVRLTNGVSGTYSALASFSSGEDIPVGLAAAIKASHDVLQYQGRVTWAGEDVPSAVGMGMKLNLTVGAVTYANLLIQQVIEDVGAGRMTLELGPAAHLGVADLIELLRVNRYRLVYNNPATRTQGLVSGDGTVTLGKGTARENTTGGLGNRSVLAVTAAAESNTMGLTLDAENGKLVMEEVDNTGALAANVGRILLKLSEALGKEIKLREYEVCVNDVRKLALFLASAPYDPPP